MTEHTEPIFNLYYIIENGIIRGRAAARHFHDGTDEQKLSALKHTCRSDAEKAKRYPVPENWVYVDSNGQTTSGLSWDTYQQLSAIYGDVRWFEDIFEEFDAPPDPLMIITCIVDGKVKIEGERQVT